jgi:hypothetical protein
MPEIRIAMGAVLAKPAFEQYRKVRDLFCVHVNKVVYEVER